MLCPICGMWMPEKLYDIHLEFHKQVELDKNPDSKPKESTPEEAPKANPDPPIPVNFQALKAHAKKMGVDLGKYRSKHDIVKEIKRLRDVADQS